MVYGFSPILPAYPAGGMGWAATVPSRDYSIFGVKGSTKVLGIRTVRVPAGTSRHSPSAVRSPRRDSPSAPGSGRRRSLPIRAW